MVHASESFRKRRGKWPQHLAACLAALATLCAGTLEGWTSPALPYLQGDDYKNVTVEILQNNTTKNSTWGFDTLPTTERRISDDEASWIGSLYAVGGLFGALPAGYLADKFGRRRVLLGISIPFLLGWMIIILAHKSVVLLYAGRFVLGLATGAATVVVPLYNEEIAETSIRGELGSYMDIALTVGILYVYAIGAFVPYIWLCIAAIVVPVIFAIFFFWMPESPLYLISNGRFPEAEKSLRWLRNEKTLESPEVTLELEEMKETVNKTLVHCDQQVNSKLDRFRECMINISFTSPISKTVVIVLGLMIFQQLSGINAVIFYTVDIFQAAGSTLSPYYSTLIIGIVQVVSTYIAALVMDKLGRRILLLTSGIGMAVSLLVLTIYFYCHDKGLYIEKLNWLPLVALNMYIICFSVGFGPIPWFLMAELATNKTKGWVSAMGVSVNWIMVFTMTKIFTLMLYGLGQAATYGILCFFCAISSIFVAVLVPETKGKSREQIQAILARKQNKT